ncbi:MAG TPA: hypothetical protein VHL99_02725 [Candidatus Binatia bacterium]|nr:hypothetical protein [Candidatus Binatia bacterium]
MKRRRLFECSVAGFVVLAGCGTISTIPIVYTPEVSRRSAGEHDYEAAVKAISAVMVEDLRLPRLDSVLTVYPHVGAYEMGLRMELDDRPNAADRSVSFAVASCRRRKVLADGQRLAALSWTNRVRTLAHEMMHLGEFALADWGCNTPHYWLMEGFAEWGALTIVDRLGLGNFANAIDASRRAIEGGNAEVPLMTAVDSERGWMAAEQSVGRGAVYSKAVLAVDFLIARKGLAAVADYFARFKDPAARGDHFAAAFGEDEQAFTNAFEAQLKTPPL